MGKWFGELTEQLLHDFSLRFSIKQLALSIRVFFDSLLILLLAYLVIWLARWLLRRLDNRIERLHGATQRRKIETISSLTISVIQYLIYIAATLTILSIWGVDTTSLALGTAALGAAIGFGSQGLIQDVITGLSILAEDQLAVGDFVEISGKSGVVEQIGLRVVKLRDHLGQQHVIFNRTINMVSNFTSGAIQAFVDISLENRETAESAEQVAAKVCNDMASELPYFQRAPFVEGVRQSSTNNVFLRLNLRVLPQQEAIINTLFVDRIKRAFAAEKIAIPEGGVRVVISSDLFSKAIGRVHTNALPQANSNKILDGAV